MYKRQTKSFRIVNELASQNLFIHQLLRRPTPEQLADFTADYTIVAAPGFKCVPEIDGTHSEAAILVDYEAHLVVICGTRYAGEIKKSVFSVMNYILPKQGVFPCLLYTSQQAIFFIDGPFFAIFLENIPG